MRQIDVSDETYGFIKQLARPFEDREPEDVLNRELRAVLERRGAADPKLPPSGSRPNEVAALLATLSRQAGDDNDKRSLGGAAKAAAEVDAFLANLQDGDHSRRAYAEELAGKNIKLVLLGGIWAKRDGNYVALPFANERSGKWWLGVSEAEFDSRRPEIVLLCRKLSGELVDIVLSHQTMEGLRSRLKVAKNGQFMLNVSERGGHYFLAIPGSQPEDVTHLRGAW